MAPRLVPEMSAWNRRPLTIPPDSLRAWVTLAVWEIWMGVLVCMALGFGAQLILSAPRRVVTIYDFTNCYAATVVLPCERVAYRGGGAERRVHDHVWRAADRCSPRGSCGSSGWR